MAITVTKNILGLYPSGNDSFIQFSSDLEGITKTVIQFFPEDKFPKPFTIYPDLDGIFTYNLKDIVNSRFPEGFKDKEEIPLNGWGQSLEYYSVSQTLSLVDSNISEEGDSVLLNYDFYRGVKQVGEVIFDNEAQLIMNSGNGIDFSFHYFEGFPFSFGIQKVPENGSVKIKNLNSGIISEQIVPEQEKGFRVWIDKVFENWTTSNFMPLSTGVNKLELIIDNAFKCNINLIKNNSKCGIYLKWFNTEGNYSYFLFEEFFQSVLKGKSKKKVSINTFNNVQEGLVSEVAELGKEGSEDLTINASVDKVGYDTLRSLILSPSVQMYSSKSPFQIGSFIDVGITGNLSLFNKRSKNSVKLKVVLPEIITAKF